MANEQKKSIYIKGELVRIYNDCKENKRKQSFSFRVNEIVERYKAMIGLTEVPDLDDGQKEVVRKTASMHFMSEDFLENLPEYIEETGLDDSKGVAEIVSQMNPLERIALIENLED